MAWQYPWRGQTLSVPWGHAALCNKEEVTQHCQCHIISWPSTQENSYPEFGLGTTLTCQAISSMEKEKGNSYHMPSLALVLQFIGSYTINARFSTEIMEHSNHWTAFVNRLVQLTFSTSKLPFQLYRNPRILDEEETLKISKSTCTHLRDKLLFGLKTWLQAVCKQVYFLPLSSWGLGWQRVIGFLSPGLGTCCYDFQLPAEWKPCKFLPVSSYGLVSVWGQV